MQAAQDDPSLKKEKRAGYSMAGALSLFFHVGLFLLVGGVVIVEQIIPKQSMTGELPVTDSVISDPVDEPEEMPEEAVPQPTDTAEMQPQSAASDASPFDLNTVALDAPSQSFTLPALGTVTGTTGLPGVSSGVKGGSGSGGMNARKVTFYGIESEAKCLGFYLDFSGTMDAERKKKLLLELGKTLETLPDGMEVMIINWAGPAWTLEQQGADVIKLWKATSQSNWTIDSPDKVKAPEYFKLNSKNRKKIITLLEGTAMVAGATAWSSPFILASLAKPAPDVIYFMTDGQFGEQKGMIENLNLALKKTTPPNPVINVVGIRPEGTAAQSLKELASRHDGKYIEIP